MNASPVAAFPGVRSLEGPAAEQAADKLAAVHAELVAAGASSTAARLMEADRAARQLPFPALERLVAPERALLEIEEARHHWPRRLLGLRNLLALLPLVFTWLALAGASIAYRREIAQDPRLVTQPFLALWQDGFGGPWWQRFSTIAWLDFAILVMVGVVTILGQSAESRAVHPRGRVAEDLDAALVDLAVAVEASTVRPPANAEDWATRAQAVIRDAMRETKRLAAANRGVLSDATVTLEKTRADGERFLIQLAEQTTATLRAVREENDHLTRDAAAALQSAIAANRQVVTDQMAPLIQQFRGTLGDFREDYGNYRASTSALAEAVIDLRAATKVLADSSRRYTDVAESIDGHLITIEGSQSQFIGRVTESANSMRTAAVAMGTVSEVMNERMRADLVRMSGNVQQASQRLAEVDADLARTSASLAAIARDLERAATKLDSIAVAPRRRRWFRRLRPAT